MTQTNLDALCWSCDGYKGAFMTAQSGPMAGLPVFHKCASCKGSGLRCDQLANERENA